jgi:hypothetical protein
MTKLFRLLCLLALAGSYCLGARAQNVGIGTTTPAASAALDITATGKGLLVPRLDSAARVGIASPATGLLVFQAGPRQGFYYYSGSAWLFVPDQARSGDNLGNHVATQNLNLATYQLVGNDGAQGISISSAGRVGIGISSPYSQLANTASNITDSNGYGGSTNSLAWVTKQPGYVGLFYNGGAGSTNNGLAVKVASATSTALDISLGSAQIGNQATSLLRVAGSGSVSIGTTSPATSAALDITAAGKGLLIPRMDSATRAGIVSPATGLLVFQTTGRTGFWYYNGSWLFLPDKTRSGDNLGNHTATKALNMGTKALVGTGANITDTGVGVRADGGLNLGQNLTGNSIFLGYQAGQANNTSGSFLSGSYNLFVGYQSGYSNTTGGGNTFSGYNSGYNTTTGTFNTALGVNAGPSSGDLANTTALGYQAAPATSNTIQLGNASITSLRCQVGLSVSSDARFKYDVRPDVPGLAFITQLRPVTYRFDTGKLAAFQASGALPPGFTPNAAAPVQTGFLAQEVEAVAQRLGYRFDGVHAPVTARDHYSLAYAQFVVPLVRAVQEQQAQLEALQAQNATLHAQATQAQADHAALLSLQQEVARLRDAVAPVAQAPR